MSRDVFLSHNSRDKPIVRELARALETSQLSVWYDEWDLVPGQQWQEALEQGLQASRAIAVLIGTGGLGRWERQEMRAAIREAVCRGAAVIPVLLPGGPAPDQLPTFLQAFTSVDMRSGVEQDALRRLICGIRGEAPRVIVDAHGNTLLKGTGDLLIVEGAWPRASNRDAPTGSKRLANPYQGVAAFLEQDAERFFGRRSEVLQLWDYFRALHEPMPQQPSPLRLLAIYGPSGSGKSSVARAGLLPELAKRPLPGWRSPRAVVLTPGVRPLDSLAAPLARLATSDQAPAAKVREFAEELGLRDAEGSFAGLRRIAALLPPADQSPLIILVDQFEETYLLCPDQAAREAFIENLLVAAAEPAGRVSVILTLRSDFLGETQSHRRLNMAISQQGFLVPAMSDEQLREAIAEPAIQAGRPLDEATIELLISETQGRVGALPLLQFALTQIWEGLESGHTPAETLKAIGGVGGALAGEAQRIFERLSNSDQAIARRMFLQMVQLGEGTRDTRRRVLITDLVASGEEPRQVEAIIRAFCRPTARLITLGAVEVGRDTAEVTHEALLDHWGQLRSWLEAGRDDLRFQRRLEDAARHWEQQGRPEGCLWRAPDLDLLTSYHERHVRDMTPVQLQFLQSSRTEHLQRLAETTRLQRVHTRMLRAITSLSVVVAVLGVTLGFVFWKNLKAARSELSTSESGLVNVRDQRDFDVTQQAEYYADNLRQLDRRTKSLLVLAENAEDVGKIKKAILELDTQIAGALSAVDGPDVERVFYATDREQPDGEGRPVQFGYCRVSFPKPHGMGTLERPAAALFVRGAENPGEHVMVRNNRSLPRPAFLQELSQVLSSRPRRKVLLYVHGFNVGFNDATMRAAQLSRDLRFDGVTLMYSWPTTMNYVRSEANADESSLQLSEVIAQIHAMSPAVEVDVLAHGMGCRVFLKALQVPGSGKGNSPLFGEVVLASADIDSDYFARSIAPKHVASARRWTLYIQPNDMELRFARAVHGRPRLGSQPFFVAGLDTIDVGSEKYPFGADLMHDLRGVFAGLTPDKRSLRKVSADDPGFTYYQVQPSID